MTSSQPLTDAGLEAIRDRDAADFVTAPESVSGLMGHEVMQARVDRRALLAEVSRLHAELVHTTKHLTGAMRVVREEADRLRAENTAQAERLDAAEKFARNWTEAPHEVTSQLDQYLQEDYGTTAIAHCGRAILTALGLDQDGRDERQSADEPWLCPCGKVNTGPLGECTHTYRDGGESHG